MKTLSMFAISACAVLAVASQGTPTQKIAPTYAKMDALAMKKDISGLTKLLTSISTKDCVFITAQGKKQSCSDVMASMSAQMGAIDKFVKSTSHIEKVTNKGSSLVAMVSSTYLVQTKGDPQGHSHKIAGTSLSEDTWVKAGTDWKLKISKTVKESTTMDGKPIPSGG